MDRLTPALIHAEKAMHRSHLVRGVVALIWLCLIGGCAGDDQSPPPTAATPTYEKEDTPGAYVVKVFYGTDRGALVGSSVPERRGVGDMLNIAFGAVFVAALTAGLASYLRRGLLRRLVRSCATIGAICAVGCLAWAGSLWILPPQLIPKLTRAYGPGRNQKMEYGVCEVTIPKDHRLGAMESPSIFQFQYAENSSLHVVLKSVAEMNPTYFFESVHSAVEDQNKYKQLFLTSLLKILSEIRPPRDDFLRALKAFIKDGSDDRLLTAIPGLYASDQGGSADFRQLVRSIGEAHSSRLSLLNVIDDAAAGKTDDYRQALVFVHGFGVSFEDAARRTAQLAYDLKFDGAPMFFSWPSRGRFSPLDYTTDEESARWAVDDLERFLKDIAGRSGASKVYLVAHSMGNRCLTDALKGMSLSATSPVVFKDVILTAPDIDADLFERSIVPAITNRNVRVTLYASSNDKALALSKSVHGYRRAGDSSEGVLVVPPVETVDASSVDTTFDGHSYYGESGLVIADLFSLIHHGKPADNRLGTRPMKDPRGRAYWVLERKQ
jgi:pimeloyl-ACP methyl ester carboxylesterase